MPALPVQGPGFHAKHQEKNKGKRRRKERKKRRRRRKRGNFLILLIAKGSCLDFGKALPRAVP